jgi:hypothetical protein
MDWHAISSEPDISLRTLEILSPKRFQRFQDGFGLFRVLWSVPFHASRYDDSRSTVNHKLFTA